LKKNIWGGATTLFKLSSKAPGRKMKIVKRGKVVSN